MRTSRRSSLSGYIGGLLFLLSVHLSGATYTVTTTADSGPGSLRQAILDANANPGTDAIAFDIPGTGVQTIAPLTALPDISEAVTIDGYTQPGSSPNTLSVGENAVILIEISRANGFGGLEVMQVGLNSGTTIRGLVASGVTFDYLSNQQGQNRLIGCFVGTTADGTTAASGPAGVFLESWTNSVGGIDPADRNVIAGAISVLASKQNSITNNYIGTDASGTVALGVDGGVSISTFAPLFAELNSISGNVISGNTGTAVNVGTGDGNSVTGNLIGTDATGTLPLGNGGAGVYVRSDPGNLFGNNSVVSNTIAYNAGDGVDSPAMYGGRILHNSIHDNGGVGILSNMYAPVAPTVIAAITTGSSTTIYGGMDPGSPGTYTVELFSSAACDPSGFGEGAVPLGTTSVNAGSNFTMIVPAVTPGNVVTATATGISTSAFSACAPVVDAGPGPSIDSISPTSGPYFGGTMITVTGHGFLPGAVITLGETVLSGSVVSEDEMIVTSRGRSPGTLSDVTVTNLDSSTATLLKGWFADFTDVAQDDPFHSRVESVFRAGITAGCGGGLYCRDVAVRRDQMAVFLLKAEHGSSYVPPGCTGVFADVTCPGPFTDWVEQLHAEGITGGCGGVYCPSSSVRRDQMAVLLLKTEHGAAYAPPGCTGSFSDVPCPSTFADWVEQLAVEGVTAGCGNGDYCPASPSTRGQMAVLLAKTFGLP
jgi:hypothetical protein